MGIPNLAIQPIKRLWCDAIFQGFDRKQHQGIPPYLDRLERHGDQCSQTSGFDPSDLYGESQWAC